MILHVKLVFVADSNGELKGALVHRMFKNLNKFRSVNLSLLNMFVLSLS